MAEIRAAGGKADFVAADLREAAGARALAEQAAKVGGGHVDILVNNAGICSPRRGPPSTARPVRVNAVSPGPTRTEGTAELGEALDQLAAAGPARRPGLPEEIADAITYLAGDESSFVHGAVLPVDGGRIAV